MTNRLLVGLVVVEFLVGGWLVAARLRRPAPPRPDLGLVDIVAPDDLRDRAAGCRTPGDWRDLGEAYMALGFFPEAEACHRVAAEEDPEDPRLAHEWAFALERLGRLDEAVREFRRAADLGHPRAAECRFLAARCLLRQERPADARAELERLPRVPMARYELARLHYREGRLSEALKVVEPLLGEFPDTIQPATLRHRIALQQGDPRAAVRFADLADRAARRLPNPFDPEVERLNTTHARLGPGGRWPEAVQLLGAGKFDEAERKAREGLAVRWHPSGVGVLWEVAFRRGRPAEALKHAEELINREGPLARHLGRLGDALGELGRREEAEKAWLRCAALAPPIEAKDAHFRLAEHYEKALPSRDRHARHLARAGLGVSIERLRAGEMKEAWDVLREVVASDARLATGWFYLGEVERLAGRPDEARRAYRHCLAVDPDHGRALAALEMLAE
jgi:tetratricopeptide (TPR) repeat protein